MKNNFLSEKTFFRMCSFLSGGICLFHSPENAQFRWNPAIFTNVNEMELAKKNLTQFFVLIIRIFRKNNAQFDGKNYHTILQKYLHKNVPFALHISVKAIRNVNICLLPRRFSQTCPLFLFICSCNSLLKCENFIFGKI